MTVIVVKNTDKKIIIASDSQTSYGRNYKMVESKKNMMIDCEKIYEVNSMVMLIY